MAATGKRLRSRGWYCPKVKWPIADVRAGVKFEPTRCIGVGGEPAVIVVLALMAAIQSATSPQLSHEDKLRAISLLVESSENQRDWSENDRLIAQSVAKSAADEWTSCLKQSEDRFSRSSETVETVATAIMGSCLTEERLYRRALADSFRGVAEPMQRTVQAEKLVGDLRDRRREEIISQLVSDRLPPSKPKK